MVGKSGNKSSFLTVLVALLFMLLTGRAGASASTEMTYGSEATPVFAGEGSREIITGDYSKQQIDSSQSVSFYIYANNVNVKGKISYKSSAGNKSAEFEIKDGTYGFVVNGKMTNPKELEDNYAILTINPGGLNSTALSNGKLNTGITFEFSYIRGASAGLGYVSLDCVCFMLGSAKKPVYMGGMTHIENIKEVGVNGGADILDADRIPVFDYNVMSGASGRYILSDVVLTNVKDSFNVIRMSENKSSMTPKRYTWGSTYRTSFEFTALDGYRFDSSRITFNLNGENYTYNVSTRTENNNKRLIVTVSDAKAKTAVRKVSKIEIKNAYLYLAAGKNPVYSARIGNFDSGDLTLSQKWYAKDGTPLNGKAETNVDYYLELKVTAGGAYFFESEPEVTINGKSLAVFAETCRVINKFDNKTGTERISLSYFRASGSSYIDNDNIPKDPDDAIPSGGNSGGNGGNGGNSGGGNSGGNGGNSGNDGNGGGNGGNGNSGESGSGGNGGNSGNGGNGGNSGGNGGGSIPGGNSGSPFSGENATAVSLTALLILLSAAGMFISINRSKD